MIPIAPDTGGCVAVFGLGKAGRAAVRAFLASGADVWAWDDGAAAQAECAADVSLKGAHFQPFEKWPWDALVCMVLSPGIPLHHPQPHPVVLQAKRHQVEILGEVDVLFHSCSHARYIGITGTNGKSTTTALIAHVLQQCGFKVQVGANLGTPSLALQPMGEEGVYVLEMSSYQLDLVKEVMFDVSVLLNITPDHLDRHGGMEGYIAAKKKIFERQRENDIAIVGLDDGYCRDVYIDLVREHRKYLIPISVSQPAQNGVTVNEIGKMSDRSVAGEELHFDLTQAQALPGSHNWQNIAAAYVACRSVGAKPADIFHAICTFRGLPHRLEKVGAAYGVSFMNDSKATNADATARALAPYQDIYWILGGRPKEGGIAPLEPYFPRIRHAFLIGEAADQFASVLEGKVPYTQCGDLRNATQQAAAIALREKIPGAVVLLSPACASFDQWKSFEERGEAFRAYVNQCLSQPSVAGGAG